LRVRFIHMGDTHLCRTYPQPIAHERVAAFNAAFKHVVERAIEEKVDFIIHAGDLFDKIHPWPSVVGFVKRQVKKLNDARIPIYVVRGNHDGSFDSEGIIRGSSIDLANYPELKNFHFIDPLFDRVRFTPLGTVGFRDFQGKLRIIGVGYSGHYVDSYLDRYVAPVLSSSMRNLLILHTFIEGYTSLPPGEPYLPLNRLEGLRVDYVAVGHDHDHRKPKTLSNGAVIVCSGSTAKWDFQESDEKGFYLVELSNGDVKADFIPIPSEHQMSMLTVKPETPQPPSWFLEEAIKELKRLASSTSKKLIVRIVMRGQLSKGSPLDISKAKIDEVTNELRKSGRLLYYDVAPPDVNVAMETVKLTAEGFDVQGFLNKALNEQRLSSIAFLIYQEVKSAFSDDENLTREGNLKEEVLERIKRRIKDSFELD